MKVVRVIVVGVAATVVAGCASAPRSFPLVGESELLAGVWQGEFSSAQAGRAGKRVSAELDPCIDGDDSVVKGKDRVEVQFR